MMKYNGVAKLQVFSIFHSISGEINIWPQGTSVVFIRLSGCNLKCSYCDTADSQPLTAGIEMTVDEIILAVKKFHCSRVVLTGGEPLIQAGVDELLKALKANGRRVSVETNGAIPLAGHYEFADRWIMDYKLSSSRMVAAMLPPKEYGGLKVQVKFVCCDEQDVSEAAKLIKTIPLSRPAALSAAGDLTPAMLWEHMLKYNLKHCILNLQIHKYIWPDSKEER